jgi:hypothetical protein
MNATQLSDGVKMPSSSLGELGTPEFFVPYPISLSPRPCHRLSMSASGFLSSATTTGPPSPLTVPERERVFLPPRPIGLAVAMNGPTVRFFRSPDARLVGEARPALASA